jgi:hypothetical protein
VYVCRWPAWCDRGVHQSHPPGAACNIIGSVGSLSKLVHLQHLDIVPLGMPGGYDSVDVPRATLPHLRHLTRLCVRSLSSNNLAQLGGLTNLQVFTLCNIIGHDDPSLIVGPSSVPGLALPASLTRLRLLSPVEAGLLSLVPTGLQALHVECDVEDASSWSGSFLSGMGQLQHLTQLYIQAPDSFIWPPVPLGVLHTRLSQPAASWHTLHCMVLNLPAASGSTCFLPHASSRTSLLYALTMDGAHLILAYGVQRTCLASSAAAETCAELTGCVCSMGLMCPSCSSSRL